MSTNETASGGSGRPTVRTVHAADVLPVDAAEGVVQRLLAGGPRADGSPLLLGVTSVSPGTTSPLIEHDTAELAYVLSGAGAMVTETTEHPFVPGDSVLIEARCWHAIRAFDAPVEMLFVFPTPDVPATRHYRSAPP